MFNYRVYLEFIALGSVSTATINQIALTRCRANASAIATQRSAAAFGLALVILEDEQIIWARRVHIRTN
jgi:hypothetical protein